MRRVIKVLRYAGRQRSQFMLFAVLTVGASSFAALPPWPMRLLFGPVFGATLVPRFRERLCHALDIEPTQRPLRDAWGRARCVLKMDTEAVRERLGAVALPSVRGEMRFENVSFGYKRNRPSLRGVRFTAKPGATILLVRTTGAGKSTFVSSIPRFADSWQGHVLVDGRDVREVTLKSVLEQQDLRARSDRRQFNDAKASRNHETS